MVLVVMISALAIDFGFYYASQNQLQTSTDASALAAAAELYRSDSPDPTERQDEAALMAEDYVQKNQPNLTLDSDDITFGFIDPLTKKYEPASFETVSNDPAYALTGGMNAARIRLMQGGGGSNGPLQTIMAKTLGIDTMSTGAFSLAFLDRGIATINSGLRPVYACEAQVTKAIEDGIAENNVIRIYGDRMEVDGVGNLPGCPAPGSGNWGFADLRNCDPDAPSAHTTAEWFDKGYEGTVQSNECYSTQSGNFLTNGNVQNALDTLIANKTIITIPVYDAYSGGGSNTNVNISGFVGFVITGYEANTAAANRNIQGYFTKTVCGHECTTSNDGSGSGGLVVKLRLAYQS
jgi:hypothetical protein